MKRAVAGATAMATMFAAFLFVAVVHQTQRCGAPPTPAALTGAVPGQINTTTDFAWALLAALGAPATQTNAGSIVGWEDIEGGHWHNSAIFNPLNTTLLMPGSHAMNSVGVQAYTSWAQGIQATVQTLQHGYNDILAAFASGLGLTQPLAGLARWSGGGYDTVTPVPVVAPPPQTPTLISTPGAGAGYVNPFAQAGWQMARIDQGFDAVPLVPLPVVAIGAGVITYSSTTSGWPGGAFIVYQLSDGSHAGEYIYVAEHLQGLLPAGTQVTAGQTIATAYPGYPWTESGEAAPPGTSPTPVVQYGGAPDGTPMAGGLAFARFLEELGVKPLMDPGPGPDRISTGPAGPATLISAPSAGCTAPTPAATTSTSTTATTATTSSTTATAATTSTTGHK